MEQFSSRETYPGKENIWEIERGRNLKLISAYPSFEDELKSALDDLLASDEKARPIYNKIKSEIEKQKLTESTYKQLSKWCDWSRKRQELLAKKISRILFGFDMPRMVDQTNKDKDEKIIQDFLKKVTNREIPSESDKNYQRQKDMVIRNESTLDNKEISERYKDYCESGRIEFITFHPAYSYEEFIEGITVETEDEGHSSDKIQYTLKAGIFKELCKRALGTAMNLDQDDIEDKSWKNIYHEYCENKYSVDFDSAPKFVLIIDEINRGDIAKIFGELITLIEADKRIGAENELIVKLPVSGDPFGVPMNVYIIGTMNTADRSIALVDVALRRRFGFIEMNPDFNILREEHLRKKESLLKENGVYDLLERSITAIESINIKISDDPSIGRDKQIGHSFLFKVETVNDLVMVWRYEIFPLLEEYCYSDYKKINKIVFNRDDNTEWITETGGIQPIDENNIGDMLGSVK